MAKVSNLSMLSRMSTLSRVSWGSAVPSLTGENRLCIVHVLIYCMVTALSHVDTAFSVSPRIFGVFHRVSGDPELFKAQDLLTNSSPFS